MRKLISSFLGLSLLFGGVTANAQTAKKIAPAETAKAAAPASTIAPAESELLGLLPASDLIAVVDVGRVFNDLLPRLSNLSVGGLDKMAREIAEFTQQTGIEPAKVRGAVLGLNLSGLQANGVVIINGLELDNAKIEAAMKVFKAEYKTADYKGKTLYSLVSKVNAPAAGPLSVKTDETVLAALDGQKLVLGDASAVKQTIEIQSGGAKGGIAPTLLTALNETRSSALLRFALNIPADIKQGVADQGDLFKSVGAIKAVLGTFDISNDFSFALDTILRTASQKDATELEDGLKGLVTLLKGIFGGNGDPKTDIFGPLFDQIKISSKLSDVSLSIGLPRSFLDQLTKKPAADEKKAEEKKP